VEESDRQEECMLWNVWKDWRRKQGWKK